MIAPNLVPRLGLPFPIHERCTFCPSPRCCRQISLEIDKPLAKEDFEDLLWFVSHAGVSIFVDEGDWYLSVDTNCRFLQASGLCGIYENRPEICAEYSADACDRDGDVEYELSFETFEELLAYAQVRFPSYRSEGPQVLARPLVQRGPGTRAVLRSHGSRRTSSGGQLH